MYDIFLQLHSIVRWAVLLAALYVLYRSIAGIVSRRSWTSWDHRAGLAYSLALDIQFLIGLFLYIFLSPMTTGAFQDMGAAMSNKILRFWAVEHPAAMLVALVLVHIGRSRSKRLARDHSKHRSAAIFYGIATILVLIGIPWPFLPYGRPMI